MILRTLRANHELTGVIAVSILEREGSSGLTFVHGMETGVYNFDGAFSFPMQRKLGLQV